MIAKKHYKLISNQSIPNGDTWGSYKAAKEVAIQWMNFGGYNQIRIYVYFGSKQGRCIKIIRIIQTKIKL